MVLLTRGVSVGLRPLSNAHEIVVVWATVAVEAFRQININQLRIIRLARVVPGGSRDMRACCFKSRHCSAHVGRTLTRVV